MFGKLPRVDGGFGGETPDHVESGAGMFFHPELAYYVVLILTIIHELHFWRPNSYDRSGATNFGCPLFFAPTMSVSASIA
jgi:hypothetical protein